jgi:hypothetical protein
MKAKYRFTFDPAKSILHVSLSGFFNPTDLSEYLSSRAKEREQARHLSGRLRMIVDARAAPVQSPDTAAEVQSDWEDAIRSPLDKIAVIPSSALHAMQTRRTIQSEQIRVFMSVDEAEQWLMSDEAVSS